VVASGWRASGILNARSGTWLDINTARDIAGTGIQGNAGNRVNQVKDDPYGTGTLSNYLSASAFAYPDAATGQLGTIAPRSVQGPGFWTVDLALARNISIGGNQTLELRLESFNLLNNFNWGDPVTNFDSGTFGQILTMAGAPRIMQFGVKYGF